VTLLVASLATIAARRNLITRKESVAVGLGIIFQMKEATLTHGNRSLNFMSVRRVEHIRRDLEAR
jgi:hypothetical protein